MCRSSSATPQPEMTRRYQRRRDRFRVNFTKAAGLIGMEKAPSPTVSNIEVGPTMLRREEASEIAM